MSKPTIQIHDVSTDEVIIREMTTAEIKLYEADLQRQKTSDEIAQAEATAKAAQRRAILDHLKITEEEARILLGGN
jgi:hypothetical protein